MFENPILFGLLVSIIITLIFFFVNKEKDKKNKDPGKNTKYLVVFGIMFIISLIGKICYSSETINNIEDKVEKILSGGANSISSNNIEVSTPNISPSVSGETPPF